MSLLSLRRGLVLTAALALAAGTLSATPAFALGHAAHRSGASTDSHKSKASAPRRVRYAVDKRLCAKPARPTDYTCDALRRVTVAKGTPGARAYTLPSYQRGPNGGLTPADLARAYHYNPAVNRRYQTVGIVDWYDDPHAVSDLNRFDAHYHLPRETPRSFRKVNQAGKRSPLPQADRSSSGEITLDIEAVRAVCHACRILLVEAKGPSEADLALAENTAARLGATEISNSYGAMEHNVPAKVRQAFNHPGVVITASTGDAGWNAWDYVNANYKSPARASYPSTDPHVVSVGGTSLHLNSAGARSSETVWNGDGLDDSRGLHYARPMGASGGGCSRYFAAPAWQRKHAGYVAAGCRGKRLAADVAADADPQTGFDVINTYHRAGLADWQTVGGTSLSAPLIAAMYALAGGAHGSAYPAAALYINANHHPYTRFDVTQGGNSFCGGDTTTNCSAVLVNETTPRTRNPNAFGGGVTDCSYPRSTAPMTSVPTHRRSECNAVTGFDGPTGIGTPRSLSLFTATNPTVAISHPASKRKHYRTRFHASAHEHFGNLHPTYFRWSFGDGHYASGTHSTVYHRFARAGTFRVALLMTDSSGQVTTQHVYQKVH